MDNVTHALAGCLLAAGTVAVLERRGVTVPQSFRRAAVAVGIITAELPDADLLYAGPSLGMGKLGYLLHHRGHTHTVLFAVVAALLVWLVTLAFRKQLRDQALKSSLLVLALLGTLSHLALDFTNNYGVHPFWPVSNRWYYGDAVFIVEPWLWVCTIPVLFFRYRSVVPRVLLALLLVAILLAAWVLGMVGRDVAAALTVATLVWFGVARKLPAPRQLSAAIAAWLFVEAAFFAASWRAGQLVRAAVGESTYRDVALTPFVGNLLCHNALVIELDGATYRVSEAVVATFSAIRPATNCASAARGGVPGTSLSTRVATLTVRWAGEWSAPVADLRRIVRDNCEIAAAMQFIRAPAWRELQSGGVEIGDVRFGSLSAGFAAITASPTPAECPRFVPGWIPPRADLLSASP
ncbi:MAG: metal-dependent hydrolase [Phycisphaerae bacterium]|nr:metal-dependent hydrolase [Gemmatimonadaceae bacterium]